MAEGRPDILLVLCPPWGVISPPVGPGYLAASLRRQGFRVRTHDLNLKLYQAAGRPEKELWHVDQDHLWRQAGFIDRLAGALGAEIERQTDQILASGAPVIGFSLVDPNERFTALAVKAVKQGDPTRTIILGGPACASAGQRRFFLDLAGGGVDYFIAGEGEDSLPALLAQLQAGQEAAKIPGVVPVEGNPGLNPPAGPEKVDLAKVAWPSFEEFDLAEYHQNGSGRSLTLLWGRGCIGRCLFCKERSIWGRHRSRQPEDIVVELSHHVGRYGIRNFVVYDSAVNSNPGVLKRVCEAIAEAGLEVTWSAEAIALANLTPELLAKMRRAGCHTLVFGLESGSDKVLKAMGKLFLAVEAKEALERTSRAGIKVAVNILCGFPGEGEAEFAASLDFLRRNRDFIDRLDGASTCQVVEGTELARLAPQWGLRFPAEEPHDRWSTPDGNNWETRQERVGRVVALAGELGLEVGRTFLAENRQEAPEFFDQAGQRRPGLLRRIKSGWARIAPGQG